MHSKPSWPSKSQPLSPLRACKSAEDITWPEVRSRLETEVAPHLQARVRQCSNPEAWQARKAEWEQYQWVRGRCDDYSRKYQGAAINFQWELCKKDIVAELERQKRELDKCKKWEDYLVVDNRLKYLDMVLDTDYTLQQEVKNSQEEQA